MANLIQPNPGFLTVLDRRRDGGVPQAVTPDVQPDALPELAGPSSER
jgi:hypothetical protein